MHLIGSLLHSACLNINVACISLQKLETHTYLRKHELCRKYAQYCIPIVTVTGNIEGIEKIDLFLLVKVYSIHVYAFSCVDYSEIDLIALLLLLKRIDCTKKPILQKS